MSLIVWYMYIHIHIFYTKDKTETQRKKANFACSLSCSFYDCHFKVSESEREGQSERGEWEGAGYNII
jgi:hypothetical protein